MKAPRRRHQRTERELAAELHAHRNDPGEWDETPVQATVRASRDVVTSVRLPVATFVALQEAARNAGQTVSEYVRTAITIRLHPPVAVSALQIASGASPEGAHHATFLAPSLEGGRTQNPGPVVRVPEYANLTR